MDPFLVLLSHDIAASFLACVLHGCKYLINHLNQTNMGNLLYIIAVVLVIMWLVGAYGYGSGGLIHSLLVIAIIAALVSFISGRRRA